MAQTLLTTAMVAARLDRSVYTVNRYVREGRLAVEFQFPGPTGARLFHPAEVERLAASIARSAA